MWIEGEWGKVIFIGGWGTNVGWAGWGVDGGGGGGGGGGWRNIGGGWCMGIGGGGKFRKLHGCIPEGPGGMLFRLEYIGLWSEGCQLFPKLLGVLFKWFWSKPWETKGGILGVYEQLGLCCWKVLGWNGELCRNWEGRIKDWFGRGAKLFLINLGRLSTEFRLNETLSGFVLLVFFLKFSFAGFLRLA